MLIRWFSLLLFPGLSTVCAQAQVTPGSMSLVPGKPVERALAGGETQTYQIKLVAGQFMRAVLDQKGLDVAIALVGLDGKQIVEMDQPTSAQGAEVAFARSSPCLR